MRVHGGCRFTHSYSPRVSPFCAIISTARRPCLEPTINPKISAVEARWARFEGFTLLFDNPGQCCRGTESGPLLDCRPEGDPALALYAALARGLASFDLQAAMFRHGFCPTPGASYHVTAWDGLNPALDAQLKPEVLQRARACYAALPAGSDAERGFLAELQPVIQGLNAQLPIRMKYAALRSTPGVGLVADLVPADHESARAFERLQAERMAAAQAAARRWGAAYSTALQPHITLGYYANAADTRPLDPELPAWNAGLARACAGLELEFSSVSFYAFTDMARFYRR